MQSDLIADEHLGARRVLTTRPAGQGTAVYSFARDGAAVGFVEGPNVSTAVGISARVFLRSPPLQDTARQVRSCGFFHVQGEIEKGGRGCPVEVHEVTVTSGAATEPRARWGHTGLHSSPLGTSDRREDRLRCDAHPAAHYPRRSPIRESRIVAVIAAITLIDWASTRTVTLTSFGSTAASSSSAGSAEMGGTSSTVAACFRAPEP